jgi:molybdate transport system ATP-binding protein
MSVAKVEAATDARVTTDAFRLRLQLQRSDFQLQVDLSLPDTGITVLFGASGCGKTSLLRCVAGLERPADGLVSLGGAVWQDDARGIFTPTWQRDLGYVFQEASLFEHADVQHNLCFGLKRSHKPDAAQALARAIDLLGIGHLLKRQPASLSGGERQRVAIARALATQPRLLLLDEPLAALDWARRQEVLPWLEKMRDELHMPMLYVTHAADELARLADHVVVLERGTVKAQGAAQEVLARIDNPVIVGEDAGVLLRGRVVQRDAQWHLAQIEFPGGVLGVRDSGIALGQQVRLRVLARDISLTVNASQDTTIQNHLPGQIVALVADVHPSQALVQIRCGESILLARVTQKSLHALNLSVGSAVWAQIKSVAVIDAG